VSHKSIKTRNRFLQKKHS